MNDLNEIKEDNEEKDHLKILEEMKKKLLNYKKEKKLFICENKPIKNEKFKNNFFQALESLLRQLDLLKSETFQITKIYQIYKWYKNKVIYLEDGYTSKQRSVPRSFENIINPDIIPKSKLWQANNYTNLYEKDKKDKDYDYIPYEDKLKQLKRKSIHISRTSSKHSNIDTKPSFNNNVFNNSENNLKSLLNKNYNSIDIKTTIKCKPSHFQENNSTLPIFTLNNISKKGKDLLCRSKVHDTELKMDKEIKIYKNKQISEKRFEIEKSTMINEFAIQFSKLKEEIQKKAEMKEFISELEGEQNNRRNTGKSVIFKLKNANDHKLNSPIKTNIRNVNNSIVLDQARININEKLLKSNSERHFDINCLSKSQEKDKLLCFLKQKFSKSSAPSEINNYIFRNDNIASTRKLYSGISKVNDFDGSYIKENNNQTLPLSFFSKKENTSPKKSMISSCDFKLNNPSNDDLFSLKRSLTNFNELNVKNLKGDLCNEGINIPLKTLKRAFLSPNITYYHKTFLPNSGFGFMSNPISNKEEMRNFKKKKKY